MAYIGEMQYLTIGDKTYSIAAGGLTTETDPVFSASAAAGITSTDISNWNGKTSNTGTVTSVGVSNATNGGLTISDSPVTSSGSITIGHTNVLTSAQTTQAVYPIKIDKNGHISAYGSAVTIPTVPTNISAFTNDSGFITTDTNTTYTLSNALSSHKFTWTFTAGGSGSGSTTTTAELVAGTGITLTDDTTNKKITIAASNNGTVTSVAAAGASNSGITISGSPITSSGTITIGLNLSTAINGLSEGTSPATLNDYAVVQYAGGGTTTTTYHRRKLSNIIVGKAVADQNGLTIDTGYLKLTGGSVTGAVTFGSSVSADELTVGDLVVNGNVSFINRLVSRTGTLTTSGWSNNSQTITVTGVTSSNSVIVSPAPASAALYTMADITCTAQGTNTLTFTCELVPNANITINALLL